MIINVIPQRLIRAADELSRSGKVLTYTAYTIYETASSLKRSDDESMQIIAAKLTRTAENLERRSRVIKASSVALYRVAEIYAKTEDNIQSFEDMQYFKTYVTYKAHKISLIQKAFREKTFDKF